MTKMKTVLSGIRPTGQLHLGNYFGALKNFVQMQHEARCYFFIADYHALTTHPDPAQLHGNIRNVLAEYLAAGLDPEVATIYVQSDVPQTAELSLLLGMHAYVGELERTVSFKEKVRKHPDNVNVGLLSYPVLQAADILIHRADYVPIGKDQEQHLEITRKIARRFNNIYGVEFFPDSQAFENKRETIKVPGLDGSGKMGKSEGNGIFLADSDEVIRKKVMRAVTDSGPVAGEPMGEAVSNIFTVLKIVSTPEVYDDFLARYNDGTIRYGDLKKQLAEDIISVVSPIRARIEEIKADDAYLHKVVTEGAGRARASADATVSRVREIMGIKPF